MMEADNNLAMIYSEVLKEVVFTITSISLEVLSEKKGSGFSEMVGVMSLNGQKRNGVLFITAPEAHIRLLCSYMVGVPEAKLSNEDVEDALCELVNIVAGTAKLRLSTTDYSFNLSAPFVVRGDNMAVGVKNKTRLISRELGNDDINVGIKVFY